MSRLQKKEQPEKRKGNYERKVQSKIENFE